LNNDTSFEFDKDCEKAFECLKKKLTTAPVITAPDWSITFELMCNASDYAVGVVLGQRKEKLFYVIHLLARCLMMLKVITLLLRRNCWQLCTLWRRLELIL